MLRPASTRILASITLALALFAAPGVSAADPSALWHVVHDHCAPDMQASGKPAPCVKVDLAGGYAVLKDIRGVSQLLLIPTRRVAGIESPDLLAPGTPNYWQDAWAALPLFAGRLNRPVRRDDIGLAINSIDARSQNQLHIHIDCVRPDVRAVLRANETRIGGRWSDLEAPLAGHHYRVMRLDGADLGGRDPFKLLAGDPAARADMGQETLVVLPSVFRAGSPGFVLLSDRARWLPFDRAGGEELLDHSCAVLGR
jgi:CDP-diacylglycerol pyrophosphatase